MQFIYIDESGTGAEPIGVMVGVIANSYRMRPTKEHWNNLLDSLSRIVKKKVKEIHTRDLYSGNSPWRDLNDEQRTTIITAIFNWLKQRKHAVVYTAVDKSKFNSSFHQNEVFAKDVGTLWRFMALHLSLSLQKFYQGSLRKENRTLNTKDSCVMVFDNEHTEKKRFTNLILNAPEWTDSYYDKALRQERFSQIVDVPHFVDSKDVGLIQLADFLSYFLRKHIELQMSYVTPSYTDEADKVKQWVNILLSQSIPKSNIFRSRGQCACSELFYRYAPEIIRE